MWHLILPMAAAVGGLILTAYARAPITAMVALTLAAVGVYCSFPVFWSISTARLRGTAAAAGIALINAVGNVGGYIGPVAMGWLKQRSQGYSDGLLLLATGVAVGMAVVVSTRERPVQ